MALTQQDRPIQIDTPLGEDKLLVYSFAGREAISELFSFQLELISEDANISPSDIIGKNVNLWIQLSNLEDSRCFNGFVSHFVQSSGTLEGYPRYQARLVPWLWFLTRTSDCVIFQNKSVKDIIGLVFNKYGFQGHTKDSTSGSYEPYEYCVQYRESAFAFVQRLMEQEGIFYFFEHEEGKHTLVMGDAVNNHENCPLEYQFRWEPASGPGFFDQEDYIRSWERHRDMRPGQWTQADFNFKTPNTHLLGTVNTLVQGTPQYEMFDYPGKFLANGAAKDLTKIRMQEEEALHDVIYGESVCRALASGYRFELSDHWRRSENGKYVVTSVNHEGMQSGFRSGQEAAHTYANTFTSIPYGTQFRPSRVTPKPIVRGTQTALVVGPSGEEIYTDEYGRVKVQFHWDRLGKYDENSSCWIRVAQPVAGKGWGGFQLPRIGQEVVVDFLEGDPDRPLITGCVYNAECMPPYALPDQKTKSTLKSYSSKGGAGFNEIRMEDLKGSEQLFMHAEKDLDMRVKNDRKEWIGNDRHLYVKQDKKEKIDRDEHGEVTRDRIEKIGRDHHLQVAGKQTVKVSDTHSFSVTGNVAEQFQASHSEQVSQNYYLKATQIVLEGAAGITLKVGGNFVTLSSAGVMIVGSPMVMINSGGAALSGVPGNLVPPMSPTDALLAADADPGKKSDLPAAQAPIALPPPPDFGAKHTVGKAASAGDSSGDAGASSVLAVVPASPDKTVTNFAAETHDPDSPENQDKKAWIEIQLLDEANNPVPGEPYAVILPDGTTVADGTLDAQGKARVENIDPGTCQVTFPNLDKDAWQPL